MKTIDSAVSALDAALQVGDFKSRDWHLSDWAGHRRRYRSDLEKVAEIDPQGPILEVGAAPCHFTALLALAGYTVTGVDLAPGRIDDFIAQFGLDVRACDIEREALPFQPATFSCVLLCETFEHLRVDPAYVLAEINRVLIPGGVLLFTTPNFYAVPNLARLALGRSIADPLTEFGKLRGVGHMGHVREYSAREVTRFLAAFGFAIDRLQFRHYSDPATRRGKALGLIYALAPRRLHRYITIVAHKARPAPALAPLATPPAG